MQNRTGPAHSAGRNDGTVVDPDPNLDGPETIESTPSGIAL
jgi:hypothetical protein